MTLPESGPARVAACLDAAAAYRGAGLRGLATYPTRWALAELRRLRAERHASERSTSNRGDA